jgi:aminoglycoside/choline kinase family phosphotransferase
MGAAEQINHYFDTRTQARQAFLERAGLLEFRLIPIGEDCAFRRYYRVTGSAPPVVLMETIPDDNEIATPGHNMRDFVKIGLYLHECGVRVPEIYEYDFESGYILLEDFGDQSFKKAALGSVTREQAYELAIDVLFTINNKTEPEALLLPDYYSSHVHEGRRRVVDWYMPCVRLQANSDEVLPAYLACWEEIEASLPPCPQGFLHIDYHFENLMWLPQAQGNERCGVLDFQGAMAGPLPYDLANLLEDARVDVPARIRAEMISRYCQNMSAAEKDVFMRWYRVLATQFHCRVIGQFIRLALRDGKERYLAHLPRVAGYIREGLKDPVLSPLKSFFDSYKITFTEMLDLEAPQIVSSIREDAF